MLCCWSSTSRSSARRRSRSETRSPPLRLQAVGVDVDLREDLLVRRVAQLLDVVVERSGPVLPFQDRFRQLLDQRLGLGDAEAALRLSDDFFPVLREKGFAGVEKLLRRL